MVCREVANGDSCVVVSGALAIYANDEESASALENAILEAVKSRIDSGAFNDVDPSVVRITYTEPKGASSASQGSEETNSTVGDDSNTPVLVGALVSAGVLMAVSLVIAYRKSSQEDEIDTGDATETMGDGQQSMIGGELGGEQCSLAAEHSTMAGEISGDVSTVADAMSGDQSIVADAISGDQSTVAGEMSADQSTVAVDEVLTMSP